MRYVSAVQCLFAVKRLSGLGHLSSYTTPKWEWMWSRKSSWMCKSRGWRCYRRSVRRYSCFRKAIVSKPVSETPPPTLANQSQGWYLRDSGEIVEPRTVNLGVFHLERRMSWLPTSFSPAKIISLIHWWTFVISCHGCGVTNPWISRIKMPESVTQVIPATWRGSYYIRCLRKMSCLFLELE